jgi:hypothetical protein
LRFFCKKQTAAVHFLRSLCGALNANDTVRFSDEGLSGVCIAASASGPPDAKVHVPLAPVWTVSDKDVKRRRAVLLILHICAGK